MRFYDRYPTFDSGPFVAYAVGKFFLLCATIASILALVGGGVVLPPFKSTGWARTRNSTLALYGACPLDDFQYREGFAAGLFKMNPDWRTKQKGCIDVFNALAGRGSWDTAEITLDVGHTMSLFALHAVGVILAGLALFINTRRSPVTVYTLTGIAFLFQAVGFSLAVYNFNVILTRLRAATSTPSTSTTTDGLPGRGSTDASLPEFTIFSGDFGFEPGMFLSGAGSLCYIMASALVYVGYKAARRQ
ncbi:hypothetical protein HK102_008214, partial [Quaeritorhiza haematococci]